ncbi:EAL domain-containing protein [uncultured Propionivibrio sp.]|uniref:EAL domain-containing protein n=1 Tax=uncultured Propionivibrio sp. TaxID=426737 RepID=UPI0029C01A43|nr:EAL domain-containing protein [uncultured Propionivibrio sp.]
MLVHDKVLSYFTAWNRYLPGQAPSLQFDDTGIFGGFGGMRLYSAFQPILSADTLRPVAFEALLRARDANDSPLSPAEAFRRADTPDQVVYLDRLCRVVHAINFFNQDAAAGDLFLNVSGRHLMRVDTGHGSTFEKLLGYCGLTPHQIVLEILEAHVGDLLRLQEAILAYRSRGFRIAIDDFGCAHSNFDRLWQLTPDIVKIDRSLIVQAEQNPRARRILPKIVEIIQELGAIAVCEGIETAAQHDIAVDAGADYLQGFHYGRPTNELMSHLRPNAAVPSSPERRYSFAA